MRTTFRLFAVMIVIFTSDMSAEPAKRPLRVHPENPRYFTDGSGKAVFLTGSHTWANFQERGVEGQTPDFDYERYLDFMQTMGHNFMRMWRWEHVQWMQFVPGETLIRYLPLPLTKAKSTTAGKNVPTGNNCWTLFLNTGNFKGPVAFFTPYFWSRVTVDEPRLAGMFLDSRPSGPNKALQMETQYVPSVQSVDKKGRIYARIAPTSFPRGPKGNSVVVHQVTAYNKKTLWNKVKAWFEGGPPASGAIDPSGASVHTFPGRGRATWKIYTPPVPRDKRATIAWNSFATPAAIDSIRYGFRWNEQLVTRKDTTKGPLVTPPAYYQLMKDNDKKGRWVVVQPEDVPAETGLTKVSFSRPLDEPSKPYVTPDDPESCWKKPGPVAGPFQAYPGDGSVVTYYWYRFADQPALLNADLTDKERQALQSRVEKLHRNWKKDRDYLEPPRIGKLADIDPALIVIPPPGLEVGYVPIATRQAMEE